MSNKNTLEHMQFPNWCHSHHTTDWNLRHLLIKVQ